MTKRKKNLFSEILSIDKGRIVNQAITKNKLETRFEKGYVLTQTAKGITFSYPPCSK